jgi:hypothetical protein
MRISTTGPIRTAAAVLLFWTLCAPGIARSQTALGGVTVRPRASCQSPRHPPDKDVPAPAIESTFPAQGAVVRPGVLVVRITFNVAMSCDGIFLSRSPLEKPCGEARMQDFRLSYDRRTIRMKCIVSPNRRYGFRMNNGPSDPFRPSLLGKVNFMSLAGFPLQPFELDFSTSSGPPVISAEASEADDAGAPADAPELGYWPGR